VRQRSFCGAAGFRDCGFGETARDKGALCVDVTRMGGTGGDGSSLIGSMRPLATYKEATTSYSSWGMVLVIDPLFKEKHSEGKDWHEPMQGTGGYGVMGRNHGTGGEPGVPEGTPKGQLRAKKKKTVKGTRSQVKVSSHRT